MAKDEAVGEHPSRAPTVDTCLWLRYDSERCKHKNMRLPKASGLSQTPRTDFQNSVTLPRRGCRPQTVRFRAALSTRSFQRHLFQHRQSAAWAVVELWKSVQRVCDRPDDDGTKERHRGRHGLLCTSQPVRSDVDTAVGTIGGPFRERQAINSTAGQARSQKPPRLTGHDFIPHARTSRASGKPVMLISLAYSHTDPRT